MTVHPEQLDVAGEPVGDHSTQARFLRFHEEHPHVYRELVRLARRWQRKRSGRGVGIKSLWEVLRYNLAVAEGGEFKLNNDYTAHYARLIMEREPDLAGFFKTRELRS